MPQWRMPAEWEPHEATWIAWPHEKTDWPGKFAAIPFVYAEIVRHLSHVEKVRILVEDSSAQEKVRRLLKRGHSNLAAVEFFQVPTDRSWCRDFCPTFVREDGQSGPRLLNWRFNGWAKYENSQHDDAVPLVLAERMNLPVITPEWRRAQIVLEGGSIDVNGAGALITTEECLLSSVQARNPQMKRGDIEKIFSEYLGVRHTLWLRNGIAGDDTHGHVDDLARFTDPHTVVIASEENPKDANYGPLRENLRLLRQMKDQDGQPLRVVTLPMPEPVLYNRQRLPASYANFYIANQVVLVPVFNDPHDRIALNTLAELFPSRRVVGIACADLVLGLGTLHCMTQQQPVL